MSRRFPMLSRPWFAFATWILAAAAVVPGAGEWRAELAARLASLSPDRPAEYLLLAEDVIDHAGGSAGPDGDRALARRLASLAGALDVQRLGRSAALFIAEVSDAEPERARMLAIADVLDPEGDARVEASERAEAVLALVRAFAHYRRGEGTRARDALAASGAAGLLDRHPEVLQGGSARFRADCDAMRAAGPPAMTLQQVEALHALASGSIAGSPRTWSEALARSGPAPLPEIDVNDPKAIFGVDPAECLWRGGAWVSRPAPSAR